MSSMPAWLTDAAAVQNNNGSAFASPAESNLAPNMPDISLGFIQNPASFDLHQYHQNSQLQQRLQNGNSRNASPAFQNPVYQVNPVIPSKRPRPREDSLGTSPRQAPGVLPLSRSQTPQQTPYPGYQNNQHGPQQPFAQPTPYQHLQHGGSANATPSPIMQNQAFPGPRGSGAPQRVQTASPNPFSPAAQGGFGPQISPSPADHVSRVSTPHNNAGGVGMQTQYPYGQHFTPPPGLVSGPPQAPPAQHMQQQQQQKLYQMRLQHHQQILQQNSIMAQNRQNTNPMANHAGQLMNPQMAGGLRTTQQQMPRQSNPEQFMKSLHQFMLQKGQSLNTAPIVGDRIINLMQLWVTVIKQGGSRKVTQAGVWPMIAASLGFPQIQYPAAPQEIKDHYERNLALYEETWIQSQRIKQSANLSSNTLQTSFSSNATSLQQQMSPTKPLNVQAQIQQPHQLKHSQQSQAQHQTPSKQPIPPPNIDARQPSLMNGYLTPSQAQTKQQNPYAQHRLGMNRSLDASPPQPMQSAASAPSQVHKQGGPLLNDAIQSHIQNEAPSPLKRQSQIQSNFEPKARVLDTHGGVDVSVLSLIGAELAHNKPNAPMFMELGVIDIHALTMSLQSGLHAEVRLALDTLATLSVEPRFQLLLESCEDLVETLVDCAEAQVEALAEYAPEVSDDMLIIPYEDVLRGCRAEVESLQDIPEFGSLDYELDRAVDRLICITTILRNLSFYETNHALLADATVVKFLSNVIRYLGTRNMLLRTNTNTLDFMKDIIIYLSNLSQAIELPGKEEALALLHFLLAFAPLPPPTTSGSDIVMFAPYQPSIHRYLPPAVDSLAKLLARDEPNRTYYRAIFTADGTSSPPFDLLTRTFGLAISPIPEHTRGNLIQSVEARKPYLVQGMLAAEILSNLAPGPEYGLARSWLSSEDGFALSLLRLVCLLSTQSNSAPQRHPTSGRMAAEDPQSYYPITHRGMAVLRKLAEKSKNPDDLSSQLPVGILPRKENLLGALLTNNIDSNVVRQLCAYAGLEN
ncbi:hypothetical protein FGG08_005758 [Glutinoglossum americanum]|uniref:ARID domain-containing protein n=1 Tax=Glutinoglossum americanum TaxID=1670608 RepID=A0A9P8HXJ8_9PEZI|nr:hypothetical protein FGG08_005758 [Glutinoglossum americanum]